MEWMTLFVELIPTLGFPIICVIALGAFLFLIYKDYTKTNQEREDKLYNEIALNREIANKAINTLSIYTERLGVIEEDVKEIKEIIQEERK